MIGSNLKKSFSECLNRTPPRTYTKKNVIPTLKRKTHCAQSASRKENIYMVILQGLASHWHMHASKIRYRHREKCLAWKCKTDRPALMQLKMNAGCIEWAGLILDELCFHDCTAEDFRRRGRIFANATRVCMEYFSFFKGNVSGIGTVSTASGMLASFQPWANSLGVKADDLGGL